MGESPSAFHWRMRRADWLTRLAGPETNLLVCSGPCRSFGKVVLQHLQIQLFLASAAAAASLVKPKQERWDGVWQLLQVRGSILQAMAPLQFTQDQRAGWLGSCCCIWVIGRQATVLLAMLPAQPPSLVGGEATASTCRVDKAWTVKVEHVRGLIPERIGC